MNLRMASESEFHEGRSSSSIPTVTAVLESRTILMDNTSERLELLEKQEEASSTTSSDSIEFQDNEEFSSIYFWEVLLYIPILLQSIFGSLHIVRSLVLGHALRWLLHQTFARAIQWLSLQHYDSLLQKMDPHAWPPPSFIFLAALTIVALVVHPDGLTWVFLRKIR